MDGPPVSDELGSARWNVTLASVERWGEQDRAWCCIRAPSLPVSGGRQRAVRVLCRSNLAARIMHRSCAGYVQVAGPLGEPEAILTVGSEEYPRVVLPSVTGGHRVKPRCSSA